MLGVDGGVYHSLVAFFSLSLIQMKILLSKVVIDSSESVL
jgi:hypothetical protein